MIATDGDDKFQARVCVGSIGGVDAFFNGKFQFGCCIILGPAQEEECSSTGKREKRGKRGKWANEFL
jgi:hypothetical protein